MRTVFDIRTGRRFAHSRARLRKMNKATNSEEAKNDGIGRRHRKNHKTNPTLPSACRHDQILKVQSDDDEMRLSSAGLNNTLCTASSCPFSSATKPFDTVSNTCAYRAQSIVGPNRRERARGVNVTRKSRLELSRSGEGIPVSARCVCVNARTNLFGSWLAVPYRIITGHSGS